MVYLKEDGTNGFSWGLQYNFLVKEHPTQLEEIAQARFQILAEENPEQAEYYQNLREQLDEKINEAWDNDSQNFGCVESSKVTQEFIKENNLMDLFEDFPALSSEIDQEVDFSGLEDDPEIDINLTGEDFEAWLTEI
ncbi:hypothetical protein G7B40_031305 [Aetokthonos hydrillicola Thurmond2011]|jgi:hypothetical protein|uniref:Uncharacterized protein n=1 Tax=Aetokthonos hydrillicola Thurmond2011 TaxID=2712845 RepID=A0AAP5MD13_9CYAN|nr:hypothetical protein [Aetokthonos hydrillicola]MBO3463262.1 hypothetical protein [Aetokthonos hydrillicola CCALA 1050]MBW4590513.1 hypothetical protein [Aetokthonos hydrillicola CCALA 1050]MDR9899013.1 hypothetical protein [Aetokthonos hydrillicola Thurmond2011]